MKVIIKKLVKPPISQPDAYTIEEIIIEADGSNCAENVLMVLRELGVGEK